MVKIVNNVANTLCTLALEALVHIRSYIDGADGNAFSATCRTLATADHAYRYIQAQKVLKAAESDTSSLSRLILPLASLDLTTRAGLCEFNSRIARAVRSYGCDFPLNRLLKAEAVAPIGEQLQEIEDRALVKIWPRIYTIIRITHPSIDLAADKMSAQDIRDWMHANLSALMNIQELNFSGMQLSHLPKEIGLLTNLQRLYLNSNRLTSLPDSFSQLIHLERLSLNDNLLTSLPESFSQLTHLQKLSLNGNRFTTFPEPVCQLINLETLSLNGNRLTSLPESFSQLVHLQGLHLYNNQLATFPVFGQPSHLQTLNLEKNRLKALPESVCQLTALRVLNLRANQLTTAPKSFSGLTQLRMLNLESNQLKILPSNTHAINFVLTEGNPLLQNADGS